MIPLADVRELLDGITAEPWKLSLIHGIPVLYGADGVTEVAFTIYEETAGADGCPEADANAALIAAAPDLARDVLSLADALATAERERDALRTALADAHVSAHRREVERMDAADREPSALDALRRLARTLGCEADDPAGIVEEALDYASEQRERAEAADDAVAERDTARSALDGLTAAVREYLAAEETLALVVADDHTRTTYREWAARHGAAMDAVDAAREALVAGVARRAP